MVHAEAGHHNVGGGEQDIVRRAGDVAGGIDARDAGAHLPVGAKKVTESTGVKGAGEK